MSTSELKLFVKADRYGCGDDKYLLVKDGKIYYPYPENADADIGREGAQEHVEQARRYAEDRVAGAQEDLHICAQIEEIVRCDSNPASIEE